MKHSTADNYEHFLSYMWASGARHNALLCKSYFDGADAPHEEYEAYMAEHPEQAEQEPVAFISRSGLKELETDGRTDVFAERDYECVGTLPLYASPVRTKDLTDDEIHEAFYSKNTGLINGIRAVIAADRSKNGIV